MMPEKENLRHTALYPGFFTAACTLGEAAASILSGVPAGSIARAGSGLYNIGESLSIPVPIWRLRRHGSGTWTGGEWAGRTVQRFVSAGLLSPPFPSQPYWRTR